MPCLPLDGATVTVCGLVGCGLRPLTAAKVVVALSCVSLAMVGAFGLGFGFGFGLGFGFGYGFGFGLG